MSSLSFPRKRESINRINSELDPRFRGDDKFLYNKVGTDTTFFRESSVCPYFICLSVTFILCLPSMALAEQMVLKSGEKLEVNIIDQSAQGVKVDYKGATLVYYPFEIDSIDGKPFKAQQAAAKAGQGPEGQGNGSATENSVGSEEYLKRGMVFNGKGDYELAISNFNKAIKVTDTFSKNVSVTFIPMAIYW